MSSILHADGTDVALPEYVGSQAQLMAQFAIDMLETGPEYKGVSREMWERLELMRHTGAIDFKQKGLPIEGSEVISFFADQWTSKFAKLFGPLARVERQPIEVVHAEVEHYQNRVVENIGVLRHLWREKTGQTLALHSAWEQVRWNGPEIVPYPDTQGTALPEDFPCLHMSALFPHVAQSDDIWELKFENGLIHPETVYIPVQPENVDALKNDIAKYS